MSEAVKTAFYDYHIQAGAKMVEFAGFCMPIQYSGITDEHLAVRTNVGLFDLSHMGEFEVSGPDALAFLQRTTTNNVADLQVGQIQYSCMTMEHGGIVDDLLVYRMGPQEYLLVVNASNIAKDFAWLQSHLAGNVRLVDQSPATSLLAVQGPKAEEMMRQVTSFD
ncbi:MAG TPA: glycine cleavage system aminomethyltransferase GcvT, partial [candidate division Zixibacteria bacterium]|nr:glycine cleavage system aminomethyltransferase GcvT [candidate division Zixibacteria bacterium]